MRNCRKTPHESKPAALKHLKSIERRKHKRAKGGEFIYKCDDCGSYHITRNKQA